MSLPLPVIFVVVTHIGTVCWPYTILEKLRRETDPLFNQQKNHWRFCILDLYTNMIECCCGFGHSVPCVYEKMFVSLAHINTLAFDVLKCMRVCCSVHSLNQSIASLAIPKPKLFCVPLPSISSF